MYICEGHRREMDFFQKGRGLTAVSKMAFFLNYQILAIMPHRKSGYILATIVFFVSYWVAGSMFYLSELKNPEKR